MPDKSGHRLGHVQELEMRTDVEMHWLRALKALNPYYKKKTIDDSPKTCAAQNHVSEEIIRQADTDYSETAIAMNRIATAEYRTKGLGLLSDQNRLISTESIPDSR